MPSSVRLLILPLLAACMLIFLHASAGLPQGETTIRVDVNQAEKPIRVDVNLVQVDAIVRDSKGNYPSDLTAEDFEIREDGKLKEIESFSYMDCSQNPYHKEELRRSIALVVDNCNVTGLSRLDMHSMAALFQDFANQHLLQNDRIAILNTIEGSSVLSKLSLDKILLDEASVMFNASGSSFYTWTPCSWGIPCDDSLPARLSGGMNSSRVTSSRGQPYFSGISSFETIRSTLYGLSMLPGRKVMVIISAFDGWNGVDETGLKIQQLIEMFNRSGIVLYVLDPGMGQPVGGGTITPSLKALNIKSLWGGDNVLDSLANASGGFALHAGEIQAIGIEGPQNRDSIRGIAVTQANRMREHVTIFLKEGLDRIERDSRGYYLMSYNPGKVDMERNKFHRIKVKVRRKGLKVRTRKGYYTQAESTPRVTPQSLEEQLNAAMETPFQGSDLPFRMRVLDYAAKPDPKKKQKKPIARLMIAIDPKELTLQQQPDGTQKVVVKIRAAAYGGDVEPAATNSADCSGVMPAGDLVRRRLVCSVDLPLAKAGGYVVRAAVMDVASGKIGSAYTAKAMYHHAADENSISDLTVTLSSNDSETSSHEMPTTEGNPVDQVFAPGSTIYYTADLYRPWPNKGKTPKLAARFALVNQLASSIERQWYGRDFKSDYYNESELMPIQVEKDSAIIVVAGKLSLPSDLTPGEYTLQLSIYDFSLVPEKIAEKDHFWNIGGGPSGEKKLSKVVRSDAFITVVPADSPTPERVSKPMGSTLPMIGAPALPAELSQ